MKSIDARYSARVIKGGAILSDTKILLANWDVDASVEQNIDRIHRYNLLAKATRSRVKVILTIFRQRYLREPSVTKALAVLARNRFPAAAFDKILYFHAACADRLLHDAVTEIVAPLWFQGIVEIRTTDFQRVLTQWVEAGKTSGRWSERTIVRIAQGLMSALRDFGVLQGAVKKRIAPSPLPLVAFAYLVCYLKQHQAAGIRLIERPEWRLFFYLGRA